MKFFHNLTSLESFFEQIWSEPGEQDEIVDYEETRRGGEEENLLRLWMLINFDNFKGENVNKLSGNLETLKQNH